MKTLSRTLFLAAGACACLTGLAVAQSAAPAGARAQPPKASPAPSTSEPVVRARMPGAAASGPAGMPDISLPQAGPALPASSLASPPASGGAAGPAASAEAVSATPPTAPAGNEAAARAALAAASAASTAGDMRAAESGWREALRQAPEGDSGDAIALEAARRLGFAGMERRDLRMAETFFAAEAVIARRLYFTGKASPRQFADSVGRWASATGAMGRSNESAALVFFAQEIRARSQAQTSSEVLRRDARSAADEVGPVRVAAGALCAVGRDPALAGRVGCDDEAGARAEALSLQARQIRANAPPPPTKAEREAAAAKAKSKGGRP